MLSENGKNASEPQITSWLLASQAFFSSAVNTAITQHIQAARMANRYIIRDIPRGKYSPEYMSDHQTIAEEKDVKVRVKPN